MSVSDAKDPKLVLFELYVATAEKVSDRRAQANAWMLSVNSAIVTLYGYLETDKLSVPNGQRMVWLWAIPAAGVLICIAWGALLTSYRQLNRAKFAVLEEIEADLPLRAFTREREAYMRDRRRPLTYIETTIPGCFILLYLTTLITAVMIGRTPISKAIELDQWSATYQVRSCESGASLQLFTDRADNLTRSGAAHERRRSCPSAISPTPIGAPAISLQNQRPCCTPR